MSYKGLDLTLRCLTSFTPRQERLLDRMEPNAKKPGTQRHAQFEGGVAAELDRQALEKELPLKEAKNTRIDPFTVKKGSL